MILIIHLQLWFYVEIHTLYLPIKLTISDISEAILSSNTVTVLPILISLFAVINSIYS